MKGTRVFSPERRNPCHRHRLRRHRHHHHHLFLPLLLGLFVFSVFVVGGDGDEKIGG